MSEFGVLMLILPTVFFIFFFLRFFEKVWRAPSRLQARMGSQGIRGPAYRFPHGNTKEITNMRSQFMDKPIMDVSHDIFPRIQPHVYAWTKAYGSFKHNLFHSFEYYTYLFMMRQEFDE